MGNKLKKREYAPRSVILVGNPNVGKSVIFGLLTGRYVTVSNYPGTSVEVTEGIIQGSGGEQSSLRIIDSPGVNSLIPKSEDEEVTRNILLRSDHAGILQVADAKNLKRALLIYSQLADMGLPMVLALNMFDEAEERGIAVDTDRLSKRLGVEVIPTVATERRGLRRIRKSFAAFSAQKEKFSFHPAIEKAIDLMTPLLPETGLSRRFIALTLLAGDRKLAGLLEGIPGGVEREKVDAVVERARKEFGEPLGYVILKQRQAWVDQVFREVVRQEKRRTSRYREQWGSWAMHPLFGVPILMVLLFIMYLFVGRFGAGVCVDYLERVVFGVYITPFLTRIIDTLLPFSLVHDMLVGEYGVLSVGLTYSVAIVLPVVSFFFIFFGLLEDSGYLPRLTVMSNKIFKKIGLNGRAVLPMVLGLGCDTMATLTTRILNTKKERIIATLLLALGVPCSAQLGVIMGLIGGISMKALGIVGVTVLMQLMIVGWLAAKVLPGKSSDFLIEIPPLRIPKLSNILIKTFYRVKWFLKEAVPLFMLGTFILFLLDRLYLLAWIQRSIEPVLTGILGLPGETAQAFILGFLRRDYGAAGLFRLAQHGGLDLIQLTVSTTVMVLFVPCLANYFVMIKEHGKKIAFYMVTFIMFYAVLVGGILNFLLHIFPVF
ncbi:MAG: ferrous iron transport protein B [Deltaproteobacteria bacterium]|nr:ferrous iron transport protein B [Deltaproteobacteria bacterium]